MKKTRHNKSSKKKYNKCKTHKKRHYKGGEVRNINVRQIYLNRPIIDAFKKYKKTTKQDNLDDDPTTLPLKGKLDPVEDKTFGLSRMDEIMTLECKDFEEKLKNNPIEVKLDMNEGRPFYRIINGRHRFTRALICNRNDINAKILD